ncbi:MAG TPA: hypothetical protein VFY93_16045, partial [Planctomycetota bacterium]|nr:hypothetical protein [Planctomycetota bacterium]
IRDGRDGAWRRDPRALALLWVALIFLFFTAATGKRSVYLLPAYPAAAAAVGVTIDRIAERRAGWILWPLLAVPVLGFAATATAVALRSELWGIARGAVILVLWAAGVGLAIRRRQVVKGAAITAAAGWAISVWVLLHMGALEPYRPARALALRVAAEAEPGDLSGRFDLGLQSLTFYGKRPFFSERDPAGLRHRCRASPRTFVVMPEDALPVLEDDPTLKVEVLASRPYLQISLPGLLGRKPWERTVALVRVTQKRSDETWGGPGAGRG